MTQAQDAAPVRILLTGQCTLHWGRMEFGNIGNYYILEPFIRELHRVFPGARIQTTFQLSERFCQAEGVGCLPMDLFYGWDGQDLSRAIEECDSAKAFARTGILTSRSPFIDAVLDSDLVVDFSGDIWGDNADLLGPDRLRVGLLKDLTAELLGKPVAMLAGSPGPFSDPELRGLAQNVFAKFSLVTNREAISTELLGEWGFDLTKVKSLACPAFLFEPSARESVIDVLAQIGRSAAGRPVVGMVVCGWNFLEGPFSRWPRRPDEYEAFAKVVECIDQELGASICLFSHSNGFPPPPAEFTLRHGRDFDVVAQLATVVRERGIASHVQVLEGVYSAWDTKAIIGTFDMLVSGRVHAAVAGLSQSVPTVILDYGHEPKAHKLAGFARVAGVEEWVVDPGSPEAMTDAVRRCWRAKDDVRRGLDARMPVVRALARGNFDELRAVLAQRR